MPRAALGQDEVALVRQTIGWHFPPFEIPVDIYEGWDATECGAKLETDWDDRFENYRRDYPELAAEFDRRMAGELPRDWVEQSRAYIAKVNEKAETIASRKASQNTLNGFGPLLPELLGGSADLAGSNLTLWSGCKDVNAPGHDGNYVYYGVREFGMSAIMNGLALHGGFRPYGATFLMFSEYARNALRMAALMKAPVIHVYTHDSIGLGEDGPTHQPVEQTATLRLIPNMHVWRPCDAVESAVAWKAAVERTDGPTCLIFSRQNLPHAARSTAQIDAIARGGYVLRDCDGTPQAILIATGSEVSLALQAAEQLAAKGRKVRVVSMPSTSVFETQDAAYREAVLPAEVTARVAVEAGVSDGWHKYVGLRGRVVGLDRFGESAPADVLFKAFGFTVDGVAQAVEAVL
ncbi:transketolase-like TK C-terminal-containing protein [Methylogaea oryzae]|uniref:transketolase-like TK C-terminal-containing protein n=1 Tax=Methylogaea oryzae TaxID=1295382 RepID=UPI000B0FB8C5